MKNLHVPIPAELHASLRAESKRVRRPTTALARQAIESWLDQQRKLARHADIAAFAEQHAGTDLDLDSDLEQASLEHLADAEPER